MINKWIEPLWGLHTMEYHSALKMGEILPFATAWIDLGDIMLSEISQPDKYRMISFICRH